MIRSELIARVSKMNPHLYIREIEAVVGIILGRIGTALAEGDRVEIRDFGSFSIQRRAARNSRNPRTGAPIIVGEKATVHFKPGKAMRARVTSALAISASEPDRRQHGVPPQDAARRASAVTPACTDGQNDEPNGSA